jgi:glutamine cyclotransferase
VKSEITPRAGCHKGTSNLRNIWPTDQIVIIDLKTGCVTGRIDLSGLYTPPQDEQDDSVLNGIAYLPQTRHLLVTGRWPSVRDRQPALAEAEPLAVACK